MRFVETELPGVVVIEPEVHRDERGFFLEAWHRRKYVEAGMHDPIVQINHSRSGKGTLRGLHAQIEHPQGKLVRAIAGTVFDVAVDVRRGSPTFGKWVSVELSARSCRQIYVPPGFVHGFVVLGDRAEVEYGCTEFYHPESEIVVAWNDPDLGIRWPVERPVLSPRDRDAPRLAEVMERLPVHGAPDA